MDEIAMTFEEQRAVSMTYEGKPLRVMPLSFRFDPVAHLWFMRARLCFDGYVYDYVLTGCKFDD
jgi:hypothetical protein